MNSRFVVIIIISGILHSGCDLDFHIFDPPDETPPVISITYPEADSIVSGTVYIVANAYDNKEVKEVTFYVNGNVRGRDFSEPWRCLWSTNQYYNGIYRISATAEDNSTNTATSEQISVIVENPFEVVVRNTLLISVFARIDDLDSTEISSGSSHQFIFPTNPDSFYLHAEAFGQIEEGNIVGNKLIFDKLEYVTYKANLELRLAADSSWVFLYVTNRTSMALGPLYVYSGSGYETFDEIYFKATSTNNPTGFYRAGQGMRISADWEDGSGYTYWIEGRDFTLTGLENQMIVLGE